MIEKKIIVKNAMARFLGLQLRGSRGELLGMGRLSMRPSEDMRKTLPDRSDDACLDLDEVEVEDEETKAMILMLQATRAEAKTTNCEMNNNIRIETRKASAVNDMI